MFCYPNLLTFNVSNWRCFSFGEEVAEQEPAKLKNKRGRENGSEPNGRYTHVQ